MLCPSCWIYGQNIMAKSSIYGYVSRKMIGQVCNQLVAQQCNWQGQMYHIDYREHILITVSISKKCNEILDQLSTTPITDLLFKTVLTKFVPSYRHPPTSNSTSKCSSAAVNQFSTPAPTPRWWTVNLSHLRHNVNIIIIVGNIQFLSLDKSYKCY